MWFLLIFLLLYVRILESHEDVIDFVFCHSQDCINWHLLPYADMGQKFKAGLLEGRFTGDPSFEYEHSVSHKVGEDESDQIVSVSLLKKTSEYPTTYSGT